MRRCEDEKMFYRLPLLEEPCAQTLSGKRRETEREREREREICIIYIYIIIYM